MSQCENAGEVLTRAETIERTGKHGDELLEFCFRRVFESLGEEEKLVLKALALFSRPLPSEAVLVGTTLPGYRFSDVSEILLEDSLMQRVFDPHLNDYEYGLLPITHAFVYGEVKKEIAFETTIRKRLADYYEARDIADARQRVIIREVRQGKTISEGPLLDLARAADRREDLDTAEQLFQQALQRNPLSWRAAKDYAEFLRHKRGNTGSAIKYYEQAAANSPRMGPDRGLIFREWGMLLRDSGEADSTDRAIEKFEIALEDLPNDPYVRFPLASLVKRKGMFKRVIQLLEPLEDHSYEDTRRRVRPLLLEAYEQVNEILKAAQLRTKIATESRH